MTLSKGFIYNVPHSVRPHTARKTYWLQLSEINPRVSLETNTNVLKTTLAGFICYYYSIQSNCVKGVWKGMQGWIRPSPRNVRLYNFRTSDPSDQWPVPDWSTGVRQPKQKTVSPFPVADIWWKRWGTVKWHRTKLLTAHESTLRQLVSVQCVALPCVMYKVSWCHNRTVDVSALIYFRLTTAQIVHDAAAADASNNWGFRLNNSSFHESSLISILNLH